jgi:hypothetical protein
MNPKKKGYFFVCPETVMTENFSGEAPKGVSSPCLSLKETERTTCRDERNMENKIESEDVYSGISSEHK